MNFANTPSARYGMASASSLGNGLYIFGGFGMQGSTPYTNPYMAYGSYNSAGMSSYRANPAGSPKKGSETPTKQKRAVSARQNFNYNQMNNPTGYNNYNYNDDRIDENYYPLGDTWYLSYL
mgnify:CR=1 FL=1